MTTEAMPAAGISRDGAWVGRDEELRCLRAGMRRAAAGIGSAVLIEGEPGAGKTALLSLAAREAPLHGLRVLRSTADALGGDVPLLAWRECLGSDAVSDIEAASEKAAAFDEEGVLALVRRLCAESPVLLAIDDLHHADAASIRLWERLAARAHGLALLLVGSRCSTSPRARNQDPDGAGPIGLRMAPLTGDETDGLIRLLAGVPAGPRLTDLATLAAGNPRLVRALMAGLAAEGSLTIAGGGVEVAPGTPVPAHALAAAAASLAGLPPEARAVLRLAALLGVKFGVAHLGELSGRDLAPLLAMLDEPAMACFLADAGGSHLRFRNPLIQLALYADIPVAMRAVLHHRAAQILADESAPVERVAQHLIDAAEAPEGWALDWLTDQARTLTVSAPVTACELFRQAVDYAPNSQLHMAVLWKYLSATSFRTGRPDTLETTRRFRAQATDADHRAFADMLLSAVLLQRGHSEEALEVADGGGRAHGGASEPGQRRAVRFLGLRARVLCYQGRYSEAEPLAAEVLERGGRLDDPTAVVCAHHVLGRARLAARDHVGALAALEAGLSVARDNPRLASDLEVEFTAARALLLGDLDRSREASAEIARARALGRRTQALSALDAVHIAGAVLQYTAGGWDAAFAELAPLADDTSPDAWLNLQVHGLTALILAHRGRDDEADDRLARVARLAIPPGNPRSRSVHLMMAEALRAEADGRPERALAALAAALDPDAVPDLEQRYLLLPDLVRLALMLGDDARAAAAVRAAEAEAVATAPARVAAARRCRGLLDRDDRPLFQALKYYKQVPRPLELARAWEDLAALTAAQGDGDSARGYVNEAVNIFTKLGAAGDMARADARLRVLGVRRGRRRAAPRSEDGWEALTPTEVKVAGLVAKGRSNREIAATLSLSPRTVQTHVSHILVKLGFGSRSQIAREAAVRLLPTAQGSSGHAD